MLQELNTGDVAEHVDVDEAIAALQETTTAALTKQAAETKSLHQHLAKLEAKMGRPPAYNGGIITKDDAAAQLEYERKSLGDYIRTGTEMKAMSVGSDLDGGFSVTPQLSAEIVRRLYNLSPVRQISRVVTVGNFDSYDEPRQTGDTGATWVGENEVRSATTTPALALVHIPVAEIYSSQAVTQRILDDSRFDIAAFVVERVSEKIARAEGTAFVSGDGINKPMGFMNVAVDSAADFTRDNNKLQYIVSGNANAITLDGLKSLYWTLRAPHRINGSWLMSSATANSLDQLKDGDGQYLWRASVAVDSPPTLLGRPVFISEDMPAVAAGNYPVAFGNFTAAYIVADKPGVRFLRDPYSAHSITTFYAYKRTGGGVADTDAIKLLKISA